MTEKQSASKRVSKIIKIFPSAIVILISIIISVYLYTYLGLFAEVLNSPQSRTFQIAYSYNFGNQRYENINGTLTPQPDITIIMNYTYPDGILVAGEKITIAGRTILKTPESKNVTLLVFSYHNSYYTPYIYDENGVPRAGGVVMTPSGHNELIGSANITWPIDGVYSVFGGYIINNTYYDIASDDAPIEVFPREQLTQIQTNKVNVILSLALFVFALFGAIDIGLRLWPSEPNQKNIQNGQNKPEATDSKTKPKKNANNGKSKKTNIANNTNNPSKEQNKTT